MASLLGTFGSMVLSIGAGWITFQATSDPYYALLVCWFVADLSGYVQGKL